MPYAPEAGDLIWTDFDPRVGREQSGHRPALVVSAAEFCQVTEFAPSRVGNSDPPRRSRGYRDDLKAEPVDQTGDLFADIAPRGDNQCFRHGRSGDNDLGLGFQSPYAGIGFHFAGTTTSCVSVCANDRDTEGSGRTPGESRVSRYASPRSRGNVTGIL